MKCKRLGSSHLINNLALMATCIIILIILTITTMFEAITISEGRPSAARTLVRRAYRSRPTRQNFVRPLSQLQDPVFPCPCCSRALSVPVSQAGRRGRCRHCFSPLRNPDPSRGREAIDLSQTLEPVTHPEAYPLCGHRASSIDYIPRGALSALPLLLLIAVGTMLIALLPEGDIGRGAIAAAHGPTPIEVLSSPAVEAELLVSEFLNADDWTLGVAHVLDGLEVADEIAALGDQVPEGGFKTSSKLNPDGTSTVRVNFSDGTLTHFQVANIDGEDLIIWQANPVGIPDEINSRLVGLPEMEPK